MEQLIEIHGKPGAIRCDNGPELTSYAFTEWCKVHGIEIRFIQPGKPDQNAFIERFNRTYREEVLTPYLFDSLIDVQEITDHWLRRYNQIRPHDALATPATDALPRAIARNAKFHFQSVYLTGELSTMELSDTERPLPAIKHKEHGHRGAFFVDQDGKRIAEMTFSRANATLVIIDHTVVDDELAWQGMGRKLLDAVVLWARETHTKLMATCPFAGAQFARHPSIRDVLPDPWRALK
jgi:predicted GNAT family acetyltransferase